MVFPPVADSFAKHEILWSLFSLQHLCFIKALLICFNSVQWGIPAPLFLFFLLSFPFVLNSFSPHCLSLFLLLSSAFSSPFLSSPRGSECFNNDALGIWDGRTVFSPPPFSFFFLSLALIPPFSNMSGKCQTLNGGKWEETDAGLLMMVLHDDWNQYSFQIHLCFFFWWWKHYFSINMLIRNSLQTVWSITSGVWAVM